jgi:hypothetical protein
MTTRQTLLLTLAISTLGLKVFGQGAVSMNTAQGSGATAGYVRFSNTVAQAWATNGIVSGLYYGANAGSVTNLAAPVGGIMGPAQTANTAQHGFILSAVGGPRTTSRVGVDTYFQIRAWSSGYATYEDALAAAIGGTPGVLVSVYQTNAWSPTAAMGPISHRTTTASAGDPVGTIPWGGLVTAPLMVNLVSVPGSSPGLVINLYAGLSITGVIGRTYAIQTTTNLQSTNDWHTVTNLVLTTSPQVWIDYEFPGSPHLFYRAVLLP